MPADRGREAEQERRQGRMWLAMLALVLAEVLLTSAGLSRPVLLALLLGLALLQAEIVLFWFMGLEFESRGLALALLPLGLTGILLLLAIFPDSGRLLASRRAAESEVPSHAPVAP